jgi:hypothetical protein
MGALVAALAIVTLAAPASAGDTATQILRAAPPGTALTVGDLAADRNLGVVWQESGPTGPRSFLRWSVDGGGFEPTIGLRKGRAARHPRVAACGAEFFAVSTWPTANGPKVGLDYPALEGGKLFSPFIMSLGAGKRPDVTCVGQWYAVAWFDTSASPARVRVRTNLMTDACAEPCLAGGEYDLGPGHPGRGVRISATEAADGRTDFHITWMRQDRVRYSRITVISPADDGNVNVRPTVDLVRDATAAFPHIDSDGRRVALAYTQGGDTLMRYSVDRGVTFGAPTTVVEAPCKDCEAGSYPLSIDVSGPRILVEAVVVDSAATGSVGSLSLDGGDHWCDTSRRPNARQVGIFAQVGDIAEAWDKSFGATPRKLRFRTDPAECGT